MLIWAIIGASIIVCVLVSAIATRAHRRSQRRRRYGNAG